jgi:uncharacterized protein YdgA (DUF945 family)
MKLSSSHLNIIAATVTGCVLLWLGVNVYAGKRADSWMQEFVAASDQSHSYQLHNLQHQRGLLSSQGSVDVALIDECGGKSRPEWMTTRLTYQLKHTIFPLALMNIEWAIEPLGQQRETFEKLFGGQARLEGRGKVGLNGDVQSDMQLPKIQWFNQGTRFTVSPSVGSIVAGKDTLKLDWHTGKISTRSKDSVVAIDDLHLAIDLTSTRRGLGKVALKIEKFGTTDVTANGVSLVTQVLENAGRMDIDVRPETKLLQVGGKQFKDLVFDVGIHGLHGESADDLFNLAQTSCNFQNLTQPETDKLRASLRKLLFEGFSVGIGRIAGAVDGGDLDGKWSVTLAKTPGEEFFLMPVLSSQGELSLTGKDIKQIEKKTLISLGFAQEIPDGMRGSYDFANGVLKLNGKVSEAVLIETMLQTVEQQIRSFLKGEPIRSTGDGPAEEKMEAPAEALET